MGMVVPSLLVESADPFSSVAWALLVVVAVLAVVGLITLLWGWFKSRFHPDGAEDV